MRFWKRKKHEAPPSPLAIWLVEKKGNIKKWWVRQMVKLAAKLSISQQRTVLIMLCLFCSAYSGFLVIHGITVVNDTKAIPIKSISRPDSPEPIFRNEGVKSGEIARVKQLLYTIDSLKNNPSGKPQYDSILRYQPGLLDTLKMLEKYYITE